MKWTSILQSLPEEWEDVILFDETEGLTVGYYRLTSGFIQSADGLSLGNVSHWMPAPQAPERFLHAPEHLKF